MLALIALVIETIWRRPDEGEHEKTSPPCWILGNLSLRSGDSYCKPSAFGARGEQEDQLTFSVPHKSERWLC